MPGVVVVTVVLYVGATPTGLALVSFMDDVTVLSKRLILPQPPSTFQNETVPWHTDPASHSSQQLSFESTPSVSVPLELEKC